MAANVKIPTRKRKTERTLPPAFQRTLRQYEILDRALCFLMKNRVTTTLDNVASFYERMSADVSCDPSADASLTATQTRSTSDLLLSFTIFDTLDVVWAPCKRANGSGSDGHGVQLEFTFPKIGGTAPSNSARRLKAVEKALMEQAVARHAAFLTAHERWHLLVHLLTGSSELRFVASRTWHPEWKWSGEDGENIKSVYVLPSVSPPPRSEHDALSTESGPTFTPLAPLDGDRALTGHKKNLPCGAAAISISPSTSSLEPSSSCSLSSSSSSSPSSSSTDIEPNLILESLKELPFYSDQLAHVREFPAIQGSFAPDFEAFVFKSGERVGQRIISEPVEHALRAQGVAQLFAHQAIAIEAALSGTYRHVALSTGTSSGKSVCFNVPVVESLLQAPDSVALYLYPTKALAQDQFGAFRTFLSGAETAVKSLDKIVKPAVVDGDASFTERTWARAESNVIMSNPDLLHITMLPSHKQWKRVLSQLRFVVIDEGHTYKGIFGAHVGMVLRRLVRLCRHYKNTSLQFIYLSATIANPLEHLSCLVPLHVLGGIDRVQLIIDDSAPRGQKLWCLWNPPLLTHGRKCQSKKSGKSNELEDEIDLDSSVVEEPKGGNVEDVTPIAPEVPSSDSTSFECPSESDAIEEHRASTIVEAARVFTALVKHGVRVLCFAHTRKVTELILRYSMQDMRATAPELTSKIKGYRGGYTKASRRAIERDLFEHRLLGVVATNALELGIDVGSLDVTIHVGFPGSMSSLRQQAGRAGRSGKRGLAIILAYNSPLDQYFVRKPEALFDLPPEAAIVPVDNRHVLRAQLLCAAHELSLQFARIVDASADVDKSMISGACDKRMLASHRHQINLENLAACALEGSKSAYEDSNSAASKLELAGHSDNDSGLFGYASCFDTLESLLTSGDMVAATAPEYLHLAVAQDSCTDEAPHGKRVDFMTTTCKCHGAIENPTITNDANIRQIDPVGIEVVNTERDEVIDSIGYSRAFYELFEGAIFLHQAVQYLVTRLDLSTNRALVQPMRVNYYTSSRNHTDVEVTNRLESGVGSASIICTGAVNVVSRIWGWRKHWFGGSKVTDMGTLSLPPLEYSTRAIWIDVPSEVQRDIDLGQKVGEDCCSESEGLGDAAEAAEIEGKSCRSRFHESLHGLNHVLCAVAPLFVLCDPGDIGTEHIYLFQRRPRPPRVVLFDKRPGGIGVAEELFKVAPRVLVKARDVIASCSCASGCLGCVLDGRCPNHHVDKGGSLELVERLLVVLGPSFEAPNAHELPADQEMSLSSASVPPASTTSAECFDGAFFLTTAATLEHSPVRRRRLRAARDMPTARAQGARVRQPWTNTMTPDFMSAGD